MRDGYTTIFIADKLKIGYAIESVSICDSVPPLCNIDGCYKHSHSALYNEGALANLCITHTDMVIRDIEMLLSQEA